MPLPNWLPTDRVQTLFSPKAAIHRAAALIAAGKPPPAFRVYARAARNGVTEAEHRVGRGILRAREFRSAVRRGCAGSNGPGVTPMPKPSRSSQYSTFTG
jgi:hypothetical protein